MMARTDVSATTDATPSKAGDQRTRLTRRTALALPLAGLAGVARAAPPFAEPAARRLLETYEGAAGKAEKLPIEPLPDGHLQGDLGKLREQLKDNAFQADQAKVESARSRVKPVQAGRRLNAAKRWVRLVANAARASADVVAIFDGTGDRATVDDLLGALRKMAPEMATLIGIRQQAIEHALDFAKPINNGALDLAWFEQAFDYARTAVVLCEARLHTEKPAFDDEATYAAALTASFGVLAPPQAGGSSADTGLAYDAATYTLSVTIDGRTWTIDVKQLAADIAKQLYRRLTKRMMARLATAAVVELIPGAGPFVGICVLCGEFVASS